MVFVDFSKAFGTVGRTGLWQLLRRNGCPQKFTTMIEALHTGMMAKVLEGKFRNRSVLQIGSSRFVYWPPRSSPSSYQQCSTRLSDAWGMASTYSSDKSADLINVAHVREKIKIIRILISELLFKDDSVLVAHSAEEMHNNIVDDLYDATKKFGLKININKSEVLYQPNSTRTREEDIMVDGNKLNSLLEFTYLGSIIVYHGCIDDDIQRRMAKASTYFDRLRQRLWNNHHVSMLVKGKVYRAIVLSNLLFESEAWTVYRRTDRAAIYGRSDQKQISGGLDTSRGCHQTDYQSR